MNRRPWRIVLVVLLVPSAGAELHSEPNRDLAGSIPPVLFSTLEKFDPTLPAFLAADAAIEADGSFSSLVHPHSASTLQHLLSDEWWLDGCYRLSENWICETNPPDRSTLERALTNSPALLVGRVVAKGYGFQGSSAGQLLEVTVEEVVKGSMPLDTYFVFVPVGPSRPARTGSARPTLATLRHRSSASACS